MPRYPASRSSETRARIVALAAARIRADGLAALGVAGVMGEAGLTHGGFYAHFSSRDALLAEAVSHLFDIAADAVDLLVERHGAQALGRYVDFYLSARHRDHAAIGCPVPALSGEVRHAALQVRAAYAAGLERLAERLGRLTTPSGRTLGRKQALALLAEMAGVLAVARTVPDERKSTALLAEARRTTMKKSVDPHVS